MNYDSNLGEISPTPLTEQYSQRLSIMAISTPPLILVPPGPSEPAQEYDYGLASPPPLTEEYSQQLHPTDPYTPLLTLV